MGKVEKLVQGGEGAGSDAAGRGRLGRLYPFPPNRARRVEFRQCGLKESGFPAICLDEVGMDSGGEGYGHGWQPAAGSDVDEAVEAGREIRDEGQAVLDMRRQSLWGEFSFRHEIESLAPSDQERSVSVQRCRCFT